MKCSHVYDLPPQQMLYAYMQRFNTSTIKRKAKETFSCMRLFCILQEYTALTEVAYFSKTYNQTSFQDTKVRDNSVARTHKFMHLPRYY
jgi:hypothetical protein